MTETQSPPRTGVLPSTVAVVNLDHLRHNAQVLRDRAGSADLMAVVKADAYGHGAVPVARALHESGIRHFAVAILSEAIALRQAGIDDEILVFGAPLPEQLPAYQQYDLQVNVTSPDVARWVADAALSGRPLRTHVKVDTGMNRVGIHPEVAVDVIDRLNLTPGITIEGVWTHLATADEPGNPFTLEQIARFRSLLGRIRTRPRSVHLANSAGLLMVPESLRFDGRVLARPGIALYGLMIDEDQIAANDLRPVMTLRTHVQHLNVVQPGESVSYGRRWFAEEPSRVATVGSGYADGYPRLLTNRAEVGIAGVRRPVAGTVCMDMTMIYLGPASEPSTVAVGDEVVLFGEGGPSATEVAGWAETIPYEICCGVSPRVPRVYEDGQTS
ncbi:MAG TPA: alanine racemase [Rhodothermales bacterium]